LPHAAVVGADEHGWQQVHLRRADEAGDEQICRLGDVVGWRIARSCPGA
jgi:hypothetical protein